jgi:hypothetical protein
MPRTPEALPALVNDKLAELPALHLAAVKEGLYAMKLMRSTRLIAAALALLALTATQAAAQAPSVTWQPAGNGIRVDWNAIPGAAYYEAFVTGTLNAGPIPVPTNYFHVTPPPGTYVIQIRAAAGGSVGPLSAPVTITFSGAPAAACAALPAPTISVSATGMSVSVTWNAVAGAAGYLLQVGTSPGATQYQTQLAPGQTTFSAPVPMLGTFYVRVAAGNSCGALSASADSVVTVGASTPGPAAGPTTPTGSGPREPNPPSGQLLPMPNYLAGVVESMARAYPGDLHNSCREHGGNNVFMFRVLAELRRRSSRWGLNYKRGWNGDLSQDIVTYNPTDQPDNGASRIYLFDIISGHCGDRPGPNWTDVTDATWTQRGNPACGSEWCALWTIDPYLRAGFPADPRQ